MRVYGLADCHGICSFMPVPYNLEDETLSPDNTELAMMCLSAQSNPQRHTVVYMANVSKESYDEIKSMMDEGEILEALLELKEVATSMKLAKTPRAEKMWSVIPNPDLDPF